MKSKRLLKFYFTADGAERYFNNLIMRNALTSCDCTMSGGHYADKIIKVIEAKDSLNGLWSYLDGIVSGFSERDKAVLKFYGGLRCGTGALNAELRREIKRITAKFARRAKKRIKDFYKGIDVLNSIFCVLSEPDCRTRK